MQAPPAAAVCALLEGFDRCKAATCLGWIWLGARESHSAVMQRVLLQALCLEPLCSQGCTRCRALTDSSASLQDPWRCCWSSFRGAACASLLQKPGKVCIPVRAGWGRLFGVPFAERLWAYFAGAGWSAGLPDAGGASSLSPASPKPSAFINNKALAGILCQDHHQVPGVCINRARRLCPPSHGICTHQLPPRSNQA